MKTLYDENNVKLLYYTLSTHVMQTVYDTRRDNYHPMDSLLEAILLNNGCKKDENQEGCMAVYDHMGDIIVTFLYGWLGNDVNEYFDIVDSQGLTYLVIFMDYFKDMLSSRELPEDMNEIDRIAISNMGNSAYYEAIKKIVEVFMLLTMNPAYSMQTFAATSASSLIRFNPAIVAINILNEVCPIQPEDIPDMPFEQAQEYVNNTQDLLLLGIRKL